MLEPPPGGRKTLRKHNVTEAASWCNSEDSRGVERVLHCYAGLEYKNIL